MKIFKSSEGFALFIAILVMAIVMLFVGASLLLSRVDTKITSNFKLGTQALEVADAGLQHALKVLAPQKGWNYDDSLTCGTPPCNLFSSESFPSAPGFTYTVTVENDAADIAGGGSASDDTDSLVVLISTANGPNDTKRQIQAYVNRASVSFSPPGALYIPASTATFDYPTGKGEFTGFITGDDTDYDGVTAGSQPSVPGVATINDTVGESFKTAIGSSRYNLLQGKGYDDSTTPIIPSVLDNSDVIDVNKIALNFYNYAITVKYLDGLKLNCTGSPCTLGTDASPQITYLRESGKSHIHLDGTVTGSGVLITEGRTHLYGDFDFHGLVVNVNVGVTGGVPNPGGADSDPLVLKGNAKIFGALLVGPTNGDQDLTMKDNGKIYYNKDALDMAQNLCGSCLPQPPKVFSWFSK